MITSPLGRDHLQALEAFLLYLTRKLHLKTKTKKKTAQFAVEAWDSLGGRGTLKAALG